MGGEGARHTNNGQKPLDNGLNHAGKLYSPKEILDAHYMKLVQSQSHTREKTNLPRGTKPGVINQSLITTHVIHTNLTCNIKHLNNLKLNVLHIVLKKNCKKNKKKTVCLLKSTAQLNNLNARDECPQ